MKPPLQFIDDLDFLIVKWKNQVEVNHGISFGDFKKLEDDFSFSFEEAFYTYLSRINGFKDYNSDKEWFSFWSDSRIKIENEEGLLPSSVIWFCDHMINLCCFGFHKVDKKIYINYQHTESTECVADTFYEFIELYRKDPVLLLR